ncbi:Cyclin-dependent protein kinase inhibitor SMR4 [Linum grandiflorum]
MSIDDGCRTPDRNEDRIPEQRHPPLPPRKKRILVKKTKRVPPKNGYFNPPDDLDVLFSRRRPAVCYT